MVDPEPLVIRGIALLGQETDRDPNGNLVGRGGMIEKVLHRDSQA